MEPGMKRTNYILISITAVALTFSMLGCVAMTGVKLRPTAMPMADADDPGQPNRPPDYSGLILRVNLDSIVLQPANRHAKREGEDGDGLVESTPTPTAKRTVEITIPLADSATIRLARVNAGNIEFIDLQFSEIIPGQYATVWLNDDETAQYVRISVRARVKD